MPRILPAFALPLRGQSHNRICGQIARLEPAMTLRIALVAVAALALGGCVGPQTSTPTGARAVNAGVNQASMGHGSWDAHLYGHTPTHILVDRGGIHVQAAGAHRTLALTFTTEGDVQMQVTDPADTRIGKVDVQLSEGSVSLLMEDFEASNSIVVGAWTEQALAAFVNQGLITSEQAATVRRALEAGASLAEALAALAIRP
jgi:hypothetical protein